MSSKKVPVTLSYTSKGTQPPIFLAGSFSEPAWDPQEMDFTIDADGEHHFHKEIEADEGGNFQYKFRIGLGDWWALNEQAPTVTDALGNRNNLLVVPSAEQIIKTLKSSESAISSAKPTKPVPELVVEKVDDELHHGDDFGPTSTTGQKDGYQMRALDTEPNQVIIRSQTSTPVYANIAAEVADSAATLDREPSPTPVPDEEAGRTGERRMSTTPIPQVALTAAEVADIAAMLDQVEDSEDDSSSLVPLFPHESHSGDTTPWHERAPLFAHECLVPNDGIEIESPITSDSLGSPVKGDPAEEVINLNDPLLEPFPEDRLSILTHIRSCESRMSEDETNVGGVPPSPIARSKSRSPSIDMPVSARIDAQPSPGLDVIAEEHRDDGYFNDLLGPTHKMKGTGGSRIPDELNVIQEAEEPVEEPRNVLENLRKIEEFMPDPNSATTKMESLKPDVNRNEPVGIPSVMEKQEMSTEIGGQVADLAETKGFSNDSLSEIQARTPAVGSQKGLKGDLMADDQHKTLERPSVHSQISQPLVRASDASRTSQEDEPNRSESPYDCNVSNGRESEAYHEPVLDIKMKPKEELDDPGEVNEEQGNLEGKDNFKQDGNLIHAEKGMNIQNDVVESQISGLQYSETTILKETVVPNVVQMVDSIGNITADENPKEELKEIRNSAGDDVLESLTAKQYPQEESQEISKCLELEHSGLEYANGISRGQAVTEDVSTDDKDKNLDAAQSSTIQEISADHVLDASTLNSTISPESTHREEDSSAKSNLPISKMYLKDVGVATEQDTLASHMQKSAIGFKDTRTDLEGSTEVDLLTLPKKRHEAISLLEDDVLGSQSHEPLISRNDVSTEASMTQEADLRASTIQVDEQDSEKLEEPVLPLRVDKSAIVEPRPAEVQAGHKESQPILTDKIDEDILVTHTKYTMSDVGGVDGMLTNEVHAGKSTSDNHLSPKGNDEKSKLDSLPIPTPKIERPLTPSSIRSPLKAPESENLLKSIWRTIFVEWIGGLFASLCGGDRGPLVAIAAVVIIGPVLAMYFYQIDVV